MNVDLTLDELKTLVSLTLGTDCQLVYKLQTAIKEITKPTKEDCIKWAKLSKGCSSLCQKTWIIRLSSSYLVLYNRLQLFR